MELNEKLLEKAKNAKSAEELFKLAKENGIELTNEEAKTYFAKLNAKEGELADDELDNVAGGRKCGTIYKDDMPVVTAFNSCELFRDENTREDIPGGYCKDCFFSRVDGDRLTAFLVCTHSDRRNN